MIYVVYGNEPYMIQLQKEKFKGRAGDELGYKECSDLLSAQSFLSGISLFSDTLYAYVEIDSITELSSKAFLAYAEDMKDKKDRNLLIYLRKVKSDAKGLVKLEAAGCYLHEYTKLANVSALTDYLKGMAQAIGANFTEESMRLFIERMDYLNNENVNMFTMKNQMEQLKYLSNVVDTSDILENVPDLREGKRFALASLIAKKEVVKVKTEVERLRRERDFNGMSLMGLLHREYRIGYLLKGANCSLSEQKVRFCNVTSLQEEELVSGLKTISEHMQFVKTGVYTDEEAFDLCITMLLLGEAV